MQTNKFRKLQFKYNCCQKSNEFIKLSVPVQGQSQFSFIWIPIFQLLLNLLSSIVESVRKQKRSKSTEKRNYNAAWRLSQRAWRTRTYFQLCAFVRKRNCGRQQPLYRDKLNTNAWQAPNLWRPGFGRERDQERAEEINK